MEPQRRQGSFHGRDLRSRQPLAEKALARVHPVGASKGIHLPRPGASIRRELVVPMDQGHEEVRIDAETALPVHAKSDFLGRVEVGEGACRPEADVMERQRHFDRLSMRVVAVQEMTGVGEHAKHVVAIPRQVGADAFLERREEVVDERGTGDDLDGLGGHVEPGLMGCVLWNARRRALPFRGQNVLTAMPRTYAKKRPPLDPCPLETVLALIGGKWKARILHALWERPQAFADLRRAVGRVSNEVLSTQIHALAADGLIHPPATAGESADYRLSGQGEDLVRVLRPVADWGGRRMDEDTRASA